MCHVPLRRICILLLCNRKFCICLKCHLSPLIPYWFSASIICLLLKVGYWIPLLLFHCCVKFSSILVFNIVRSSNIWYIKVYSCYILLMNWSLYHYIVTSFSPVTVFDLNSTLSDISIVTPVLFGFHLLGESFFWFLWMYFKFESFVGSNSWVLVLYPCSHS